MEKNKIDKKIGVVVFLLVILFILNSTIGFIIYPIIINSKDGIYGIFYAQYIVSIGTFIILILGRIVIAVWLRHEAKRLHRNRFLWTVFALFFGLNAAFLFFIIEIYNELILLRQNVKKISR